MGQLRNLVPVLSGKGKTTQGVTVSGNQVRFSNEIITKIGATDHLNFQIGGDEDNRLYIRHGLGDVPPFKLKGKEGGRRYVSDAGLVKAAKLGSGSYPLLYDEELKAHYIIFDPTAPEPKPRDKAVRPVKDSTKTEGTPKTPGGSKPSPSRPAGK